MSERGPRNADDLARALAVASEKPSIDFCSRVMASVRRDARRPPALQFPWTRFGIGVAASAATWILIAWESQRLLAR